MRRQVSATPIQRVPRVRYGGRVVAFHGGVRTGESGFSLIETLVASALLAGALMALAHLFALSTESNFGARTTTYATVLAEQKLEELKALTYAFDVGGVGLTDTATDTSRSPEAASGGTGLSPSPGIALGSNTPGYVDHVNGFGNKLGGGAQPPAGASYTRRWSIRPLPADTANTIVIQVLVTRSGRTAASPAPGDVLLATIRSRKAP